MRDSLSSAMRSALSVVAGASILGPLAVIVLGLGGRSPRTPSPLEALGYGGPIWIASLLSVLVLVGGIGLALALARSDGDS